jgi:hypothetical protein
MNQRFYGWALAATVAGLVVAALGPAVALSATGFKKGDAITPAVPGSTTVDSTNAPQSISRTFDGSICGSPDSKDSHVVWFKWTATTSSQITINTLGSDYDTVLYVFGGKLIGCNDDTPSLGIGCPVASGQTRCSQVMFQAVEGKRYLFALAAFDGRAGGSGVLNISQQP